MFTSKKQEKMSSHQVSVIYSTVSGTVQTYAERLNTMLTEAGVSSKLYDVYSFRKPYTVPTGYVCYLTCTYTGGTHPEDAQDYIDFLKAARSTSPKAMSGTNYAVFGVGSSEFEHFCSASLEVAEIFGSLGGVKLIETASVDTEKDPDAAATKWMTELVSLLKKTLHA